MGTFSTITLGDNRQLRFIRIHINENPYWEFVTRTNATEGVTIVAVTKEREILLVKQHRIPLGQDVIELPAGLVGDTDRGESPEQAVKKELLQETGYTVQLADIRLLARGPALAGLTDEINGLWLASNVTRVGNGGGDALEGEEIETLVLPLDAVWDRMRELEKNGCLIDLKVFAGLYFLPDAQRPYWDQ